MKFLFVIDPLEKLNVETDSTIEIMNSCAEEGIEIHYCETKDLTFEEGKVYANSTLVSIKNKEIEKKEQNKQELDEFDLILMRAEPPYDLNYHYATMLLDKTKISVVNDPQGLRNANEKLVILNFPSVIPKTIVTKSKEKIVEFVEANGKAVIKPIHLFGGQGVEILDKEDEEFENKIEKVIKNEEDYATVQEFIEEVYEGDKRIFLLEGEPLGGVIRVPQGGDFRANMVIGGKPIKYEITEKDKDIIKTIKPYLKKEGLSLVGIDIIKDKLIEINVTCPTGLVPIKKLDGKDITKEIVGFLKKKAE